VFLDEMNAIHPWKRLCALIAPHYPTGEGGRGTMPLADDAYIATGSNGSNNAPACSWRRKDVLWYRQPGRLLA
jgi:hypothetical protein